MIRWVALVLLSSLSAQAQIFKCTDDAGKPAFQDKPCGKGSTPITVRPASGAGAQPAAIDGQSLLPAESPAAGKAPSTQLSVAERAAKQLQTIQTDRKLRDLDYEIRDTEEDIRGLEHDMQRDVARLQYRRRYANNNLAGATWEVSLSNEMQAVTEKYGIRIKVAQDRLSALKRDRELLLGSAK